MVTGTAQGNRGKNPKVRQEQKTAWDGADKRDQHADEHRADNDGHSRPLAYCSTFELTYSSRRSGVATITCFVTEWARSENGSGRRCRPDHAWRL